MKILSVLLLLALGVGAAWWKVTNPDGTIDDVRAQAEAVADRLKVGLVAVRDGAVAVADQPGVAAQIDTAMNADASAATTTALETVTATGDDSADDSRFGDILTRLDSVENALVQPADDTSGALDPALLERLAALEASIAKVDEHANTVDSTVATVDERHQKLVEQLESLAENPASGVDDESDLDRRIVKLIDARLETVLAELPAGTAVNTGDDTAPATLAPQAEERLAALETQIATLAEAAPASFDNLQAELRQEIALLGDRLGALPEASSSNAASPSTQAALKAQINTLEERLESLPVEPDEALVSTLAEVREQVDALSQKGFVTQEELRAKTEGKSVEYKIYFNRNSIEIGTDAARVLDSFIAQEKNRTTGVSIYGFTDRQGNAAYNERLALERATAVRSYLIQNGLDYSKIRAMSGFGEDAAAADQPDDEADDAQQRVVVLFAAQP